MNLESYKTQLRLRGKNPRWVRKHHVKMKELKAREYIIDFTMRLETPKHGYVMICAGRPEHVENLPLHTSLHCSTTCSACTLPASQGSVEEC